MSEFQASNFIKENGGTPDLLGKTELTSPYFFVPPSGTTAERPQSCAAGTLRFNTDIGTLEVYRGDTIGWQSIQRRENQYLGGGTGSNTGTGVRGIFSGGYLVGSNDQSGIDFITISTLGNSQDFGDMSDARRGLGGSGSSVRGIFTGGDGSPGNPSNRMGHVTIASLGNETDFGNLTTGRESVSALSDSVRSISIAGYAAPANSDVMDYISIATLGDAIDFGDLSTGRSNVATFGSTTRGVIAGGEQPSSGNEIDFITIRTTGNSTSFGNLGVSAYNTGPTGSSNSVRGFILGGNSPSPSPTRLNTIEFVTIATLGNGIDFGDLTQKRSGGADAASKTRITFAGGNEPGSASSVVIDFVEIATTGNALDFGDLVYARFSGAGTSSGHGGLG